MTTKPVRNDQKIIYEAFFAVWNCISFMIFLTENPILCILAGTKAFEPERDLSGLGRFWRKNRAKNGGCRA